MCFPRGTAWPRQLDAVVPARRPRPADDVPMTARRQVEPVNRIRADDVDALAAPDQFRRGRRAPGRIERPRDTRRPADTAQLDSALEYNVATVSSAAVDNAGRTLPPLADCRIAVTTASVYELRCSTAGRRHGQRIYRTRPRARDAPARQQTLCAGSTGTRGTR